jgi:hypothetical protein
MGAMQFEHIAIVGALGGTPTGDGGPSGAYTCGQWGFAIGGTGFRRVTA